MWLGVWAHLVARKTPDAEFRLIRHAVLEPASDPGVETIKEGRYFMDTYQL